MTALFHTRGRQRLIRQAAALALLGPAAAWAACVNTGASASATAGSQCTATLGTYTDNVNALLATDPGSVLTVQNNVTLTGLGATGIFATAIATATGNGGKLIFNGDVELTGQAGGSNTYGIGAGPHNNPGGDGEVEIKGAAKVQLIASSGMYRRGIMSYGTNSKLTARGPITIRSSATNSAVYGLSAENESTLVYESTADIDMGVDDGATGIRSVHEGTTLRGLGKTTVKVGGPGAVGILGDLGSKTILSDSVEVTASDLTSVGISVFDPGTEVSIGPNSKIISNGIAGVVMTLPAVSTADTPIFKAGPGLNLQAPNGDAFLYYGARSNVSLTNATVSAPTLWHSITAAGLAPVPIDPAAKFEGLGGTYTGGSVRDDGTLHVAMRDSAVWNMNVNSSLTELTLSNQGTLSVVNSHTLTGNVNNASGAVKLQDAAADDVLTLAGNYAGATAGKLQLDTVVGDSTSASDRLRVNGDVTATGTLLEVANIGGAGAQTTGNGILVVEVTGASPAGAFRMTPFIVGSFQYSLVQVGKNWYLQSAPAPAGAIGVTAVPTLSQWSLMLMGLAAAGMGARRLRRKG